MRYIDSGSRNPQDTLGSWLGNELIGTSSIAALRVQSGFFGSEALGYFEDALKLLSQSDGHTRFLVGSNDGQTRRAAMADLLAVAGQPRAGLQIAIVSYQSGFFHPKVFHFQRSDGSSTAYVGSANLTGPGASSLHVEAGLILDSKKGDSSTVLDSIADSIDSWFIGPQLGVYGVNSDADLDPLVVARVLDVPRPPRAKRAIQPVGVQGSGTVVKAHSLKPLVAVPPVQTTLPPKTPTGGAASSAGGQQAPVTPTPPAPQPTSPVPPSAQAAVKHWGKTLSDSDAQRKKTGNQRGAITLVQGDYRGRIDQTTFFRTDLFGQQSWIQGTARTGQPMETATVPMHVTIDFIYYGTLDFEVTNGLSRESSQNNYTAELHIEPIGPIIRQTNVAGKHLDVALDANGDYWLTIA